MKFPGYLFIALAFLWLAQVQSIPNRTPTRITDGKLFLIGGGTQDSTSSIYEALKAATTKPSPKIAVVISAASSLEVGLEAYYDPTETSKSYEQLFTDYGFQPSLVELAIDNYREASSSSTNLGRENIAKIQGADVVFFNGGDQSRHTRSWLNDDGSDSDIMVALREKFLNGTVIAGTSAGTAVQCDPLYGSGTSYGYYYYNLDLKQCAIGEELADDRDGTNSFRYDENGAFMKGFGFLRDSLLDTHFDARGRFGRLVVAMQQAGKSFGFGVDEDTALYINNGVASAVGNSGVWIMDISTATFIDEYYFRIVNVEVAYLTEGDSFNLDTKELLTGKPLLIPSNESEYNSDDVFGPDEGVKSIVALVNSNSMTSSGLTYEKKPIGRVIFRKTPNTEAYYDDGKYGVSRVFIDFDTYENIIKI